MTRSRPQASTRAGLPGGGFAGFFVLLALFVFGCGELDATNPYDPATPRDQQQTGALHGRLVLPEGHRLPEPVGDVLALTDLTDASQVFRTSPAADLTFEFARVQAGRYRLEVTLPALQRATLLVEVAIGDTLDLGDVVMLVATAEATLAGQVLRDDALDAGNGGIQVGVRGTPLSTLTAADGRFLLAAPPGRHELTFSSPGYASAAVADVEAVAGQTTTLAAPVVLVGVPGRIEGRLEGSPEVSTPDLLRAVQVHLRAADAALDAVPLQTRAADERGRFAFETVRAGVYVVAASHPRLSPVEAPLGVSRGETSTLLLPLSPLPPARVRGRARLAMAGDAAHVGTTVSVAGSDVRAETAPDGAYALLLPVSGEAATLRFEHEGHAPAEVDTPVIGSSAEVEVAEVVLAALPGRVEGLVSLPPPFDLPEQRRAAQIRLLADLDPATQPLETTFADDDGLFQFESVAAGAAFVEVSHPLAVAQTLPVSIPPGGVARVDAALVLAPPLVVTGIARLEGRGDSGSAGISVSVDGLPLRTETAPDGRYALSVPLLAARATLRFGHEGFIGQQTETPVPLDGAAPNPVVVPDVTLQGLPGRIVGIVDFERILLPDDFDAATFRGQTVVTLRDVDDPAAAPSVATPAADGHFEFEERAAGPYAVSVSLAGFRLVDRGFDLAPGGVHNLGVISLVIDLAGDDPTYIAGRAQLAGQAESAGILVEASGLGLATLTTGTGDFLLQVAPDRTYDLRFRSAGYATVEVPGVAVVEGQVTPLGEDVVLLPLPATVSGRLLREAASGDLRPAVDATVSARDPEGVALGGNTVAGPDGRFALPLTAGTYRVEATLARHAAEQRAVTLAPGTVHELGDLVLRPHRGALSGRLLTPGAVPSGRRVHLAGDPADPLVAGINRTEAVAGVDGGFVFEGLVAGTWRLTALAEGYAPHGPEAVQIIENETTNWAGTLVARRFEVSAPEYATAVVEVTVEHDAALGFAQFWLDTPAPPPQTPFVALPGPGAGRLAVPLPGAGAHRIQVRLANDAGRRAALGEDVDDPLAELLGPVSVTVIRDDTPPTLISLVIGDGSGFVTDAAGGTSVIVVCVDGEAPGERLLADLAVGAEAPVDLPPGIPTPLPLGPAEGPRAVAARCTDPAGNTSAPSRATIVVDHTRPIIRELSALGGAQGAATASRVVPLTLTATDATSGVVAVALSDAPDFDCAAGSFVDLAVAPIATLVGPDGPREISACVRDAAGNVSAQVASNGIVLDTVAPAAPEIRLAGGAPRTNVRQVTLTVEVDAPGGTLLLDGDVSAPGPSSADQPPDVIELIDADGPRFVTAVVLDAAGNASGPGSALITLDRAPPVPGRVVLADGQAVVHDRTIDVTLLDTDADTMAIVEAGANGQCPNLACGAAAFRAFAPATTLTLTPTRGAKTVCWRFCDLAGNGAPPGQASLTLGDFLARPTPIVEAADPALRPAVAPRGIDPTDCERTLPPAGRIISIQGRGIARDTRALIGAATLPCENVGALPEGCAADPDGSCRAGSPCAASCGTECRVTLPDFIVDVAGTFVVRLETPAPIVAAGGLSTSFGALDVRSPHPRIQEVSETAVPVSLRDPQTISLTVTGCGFMQNSAFTLGTARAQVDSIEVDPADARRSIVRLRVPPPWNETGDLAHPFRLEVDNPAPAGATSSVLVGLHDGGRYIFEGAAWRVGRTSPSRAPAWGRTAEFGFSAPVRTSSRGWPDADFVSMRASNTQVVGAVLDYALHARFDRDAAGATMPSVNGRLDGLEVETVGHTTAGIDSRGRRFTSGTGRFSPDVYQAQSRLESEWRSTSVARRSPQSDTAAASLEGETGGLAWMGLGRGYASVGTLRLLGRAPAPGWSRLVYEDIVGDEFADLLTLSDEGLSLLSFNRTGAPNTEPVTIHPAESVPSHGPVEIAATADLDGDGVLELIAVADREIRVHRGYLDGRFAEPVSVRLATRDTDMLDIGAADLDGDDVPEIVAAGADGALSVWHARRVFDYAAPEIIQTRPCERLAFADVNRDGLRDVVGVSKTTDTLVLALNDGTGHPNRVRNLPTGDGPAGVDINDLDGDARPDLVVLANRGAVDVFLQAADGTFAVTRHTYPAFDSAAIAPLDVFLRDLDDDGVLDLLAVSNKAYISALGLPAGSGAAVHHLETGVPEAHLSRVADVDGDGQMDVLTLWGEGRIVLTRQSGRQHFPAEVAAQSDPGYTALAVDDFDHDGIPDLVTGSGDLALTLNFGAGDGTFGATQAIALPWVPRAVEMTHDDAFGGDSVVVASLVAAEFMTIFRDRDTGDLFNLGRVALPGLCVNSPDAMQLADLNADGFDDLLTITGQPARLVSHLRNAQTGSWTHAQSLALGFVPVNFTSCDVDGDARTDVVLQGPDFALYLARGLGPQGFAAPAPLGLFEGGPLHCGDRNGDGLADLLGSNNQDMIVHFGRGDGSFSPIVSIPVLGGVAIRPAALADVDGDGVLDIVGTDQLTGVLSIAYSESARPWSQELSNAADAHRPLPAGRTSIEFKQLSQRVDSVGVRVRIEGRDLQRLRLTLIGPDGQTAVLDDGATHAGQSTWIAAYPTIAPAESLARFNGWQPDGAFTLQIDNGGAEATLVESAVLVRSWFTTDAATP
jgi:hypothetical protein